MFTRKTPLEERFWAKVEKTDGCWLWKAGARNEHGYGVIWNYDIRKIELAHRVAWRLANGPIPDGTYVLHSCDTPACVNPAHLFLGNHADNMRDMVQKGRGKSPGDEQWYGAKLGVQKVRDIRLALAIGLSQVAVAEMYEVGRNTVRRIHTFR